MATYTHYEANYKNAFGDFADPWVEEIGSTYSANSSTITIYNYDGTLTTAHGAFNLVGNTLLGGIITSLDHTSGDGLTTYESIAGTWINASTFVTGTPAEKLASALSGTDGLFGYSGNDTLNGYGGADQMAGGAGNDNYIVDGLDVVTELANQGVDSIYTDLSSYTLPANVEDIYFTTTASHVGFGNGVDNYFVGKSGQDTFYGLDGNDIFNGNGGVDSFYGGTGDDLYFVLAGDTIVEKPNEGIDTIQTSLANYVIPTNFENLRIDGSSGPVFGNGVDNVISVNGGKGMTVYGFGGNDTLSSSGGNDTLIGGNGNDRLIASVGHDTLTGGNDDDTFVIYSGNHAITDFAAGPGVHDRIDLAGFKPGQPIFGANVFHNLSDVLAHTMQSGADTVIDLGAGNSLTLENVQKSALAMDDFIWAQVPRDFNGDNHSDALWIGDTGSATVWDSGQSTGAHQIADAGTVANGWHVVGSGDFDGNGRHDIVWTNDDGRVAIWDNGQAVGGHSIGPISNGWHFAGTGDFDGNNKSDILWVNDNGAAAIWDNGQGGHYIADPGSLSNGWHFAGAGDFDGNGKSDILWINNNGGAAVWDNGQAAAGRYIANPGTVANGFHFAGTGDFDGNGRDDILWVNDNNGKASVWDNGNIAGAHNVGDIAAGSHFGSTGDFDGNGHSDILWRNDNGAVSIWDNGWIGGAHVTANPGSVPDGWHIV